jgi:branched-chain amino acid transport system ATP-binding protein
VRKIHATGCTIILVEQSINVALTIATRAYFMEKGEVRFSGPTDELLERDDILRSVFLHGASKGMGDQAEAAETSTARCGSASGAARPGAAGAGGRRADSGSAGIAA